MARMLDQDPNDPNSNIHSAMEALLADPDIHSHPNLPQRVFSEGRGECNEPL